MKLLLKNKRILSVIMAILLVVGMIPSGTFEAIASDSTVRDNAAVEDTNAGDTTVGDTTVGDTAVGETTAEEATTEQDLELLDDAESEIDSRGTWGGIDWVLTVDGTLTISPADGEITKKKPWSGELYQRGEIPAAVNDSITAVTAGPWAPNVNGNYDKSRVKKLILEEGVTSIGSFAFDGYTNLTGDLVIPSTLTYIGQQGLQNAKIETLTFAKGGTETLCIGVQSLAYLTNVKEVIFPDDRPVHVHCWVFKGCSNLETVYFPASVEMIGYNTHYDYFTQNKAESFLFNLCPKLENVKFGSPEVYQMFTSWGDAYRGMGTDIVNKIKNDPIKNAVAKIGDQGYVSLAKAIEDAKAGDTITFLADVTEDVTIDKKLTIDGADFKYIGKMTVAGSAGTTDIVTFKNIKFLADTTVGNSVIVDMQRYAEASFVGCDFTSNSTDTYYNSYKGVTVANDCTVEFNTCTASKLYYMVHIAQGSESLVVENCTLTDMVYGIGAFKCKSVNVKGFTYNGMASGINVRNSAASTLALENVNITTTMNGQSPVAMWAPDSGVAAVKYTITLKGENLANGAEMTVENEASWFARQNESNPYEIIDLNIIKVVVTVGNATKVDGNIDPTFTYTTDVDLDFDLDITYEVNGTVIDATIAEVKGYEFTVVPGTLTIEKAAASVNNVNYKTLAKAIEAANAGDTITFLADIAENVTINKNVTIDGAGFKYIGKMTVSESKVVTIKNVNFEKGYIEENSGAHGTLIIDNCHFDGIDKSIGYAIKVQGGDKLSITNSSAENYGTGMLYVPSSVTEIFISKVKASNVTVAFNITYSGDATFEEVSFENVNYGIHFQIYGSRTYTVKNSDLSGATNPFWFWDKSGNTKKVTVVFEGNNIVPNFQNPIPAGALKLAVGATLTAPEGYNVTTDVANSEVKYENGQYFVKEVKQTGTWGGIDWTLYLETGKLVIAPTKGTPIADPNCGRTYEVGEMPEGVVYHSSGDYATAYYTPYNKNLVKSVVIEDGVTTIGSFALKCPNLTGEVVIPSSVIYIGQSAFQNAPITKLTFAEGGTEELCIGVGAFEGLKITELTLPTRPAHMHAWAFQKCTELVTVTLPNVTFETGSKHVKYWYYGEEHASGGSGTWDGNYFAHNGKMESISFGTTEGMNQYIAAPNSLASIAAANDKVVYSTLAKAIAAAKAGDEIKFLADITEDVTIDKKLTIDGAGKTFTGNMNLKADTTIKNVNFDGKGYNGYAIVTRGAKYVTIEDCTATNYGYGFVQLASATVLTTVKNVTVSNMNYGIKVDYSGAVVIENCDITAGVAAVLNSNYGEKTITIKDSELNILGTWTRNNTTKTNYVFEGDNTVGEFKTDAAIDNFKLAVDATLTAPEGLTIDTEAGYSVKYEDGKYFVKANMVAIGEETYASLAEAIAAAKAGDVIKFLANVTEDVTFNKSITIDGAGFEYTGTIKISGNESVTIENVNFVKGYIEHIGTNTSASLTVNNCSFANGGYAVTTGRINTVTIENCTVTGQSLLYAKYATSNIVVKDVTVSGGNYVAYIVYGDNALFENVTATNMTGYGIFTQNYGSKTITIKNCSFDTPKYNSIGINETRSAAVDTFIFEGENTMTSLENVWAANYVLGAADATLTAPEGYNVTTTVEKSLAKYVLDKYVVVDAVAQINGKNYETLKEAIDAAKDGDEIVILNSFEVDAAKEAVQLGSKYKTLFNITGKSITIDLNGQTLYCDSNSSEMIIGFFATEKGGHLTLKDSSEEKTGTVEITANSTRVYCLLTAFDSTASMTIEGGNYILDNAYNSLVYADGDEIITVEDGYFYLGNVGTGSNASPWIFNTSGQNTQNVIVNGGIFNANVMKQYYEFEAQSTKLVACVEIEPGIWQITEAKVLLGEKSTSSDGYTKWVGYATFDEAYDAAENGETIKLLSDVIVSNDITKDVTIDSNGYTVTLAENVKLSAGTYDFDVAGHVADGYCAKETDGKWNVHAHTPVERNENEVAPTCTEDGSYDLVTYCECCEVELKREAKTVSALGHTEGEVKIENEKAPTCTEDGSYDKVVRCTVCDVILESETVTVSAHNHTITTKMDPKNGLGIKFYFDACENVTSVVINGSAVASDKWIKVSDGHYYVEYNEIDPKEMIDKITVQLLGIDETVAAKVVTSVVEYANAEIAAATDENYKNLLKAMLNYGAAAQLNFNYKTDTLANEGIEYSASRTYTGVYVPTDRYVGTRLVYGEVVQIQMMFNLSGVDLSGADLTFVVTVGGQQVEISKIQKSGAKYLVTIDVPAAQFSGAVKCDVQVNGASLCIAVDSIESYAAAIVDGTGYTAEMKNLADAMMQYGDAAAKA